MPDDKRKLVAQRPVQLEDGCVIFARMGFNDDGSSLEEPVEVFYADRGPDVIPTKIEESQDA